MSPAHEPRNVGRAGVSVFPIMRGRQPAATAASWFLATLLGALPRAAALDDVTAVGSGTTVRERAHLVEITLHPRYAELVVRRTVEGTGTKAAEAIVSLDLPEGAVATGLRTLVASPAGPPRWLVGELRGAEEAEKRYLGGGTSAPTDGALLSFLSPELLTLRVFPLPPGEPRTVEYTLVMPTTYEGGRSHLRLPRVGSERMAATAVVRAAGPRDGVYVDGQAHDDGAAIRLAPAEDKEIDLALERRDAPALDGTLAMVPFAEERVLFQLRVDAAAKLSRVPAGAYVVLVIDASRSMDGPAEAAASAARAYLASFEDAHVEVLAFDRQVRSRYGRFVTPSMALDQLAGWVGTGKNGSRIDDALARADALLAQSPEGAPRRMVVFTDLRTRARLDPEALGLAPRSQALVHLAALSPGEPRLQRDDEGPWATLARRTGGLLWNAGADAAPAEEQNMRRAYEELARPVRVDKLRVVAPGVDDLVVPDHLDEGSGISALRIHPGQVPWVSIDGELWSSPVHERLVPDEDARRLWSGLAIGSTLFSDLKPAEVKTLAEIGHVVSPATSLVAAEPGTRPSSSGGSSGGIGHSGLGIGLGSLTCRTRCGMAINFNHVAFLKTALAPAVRNCGASRGATVELETTLREVVDVVRVDLAAHDDEPIRRCIEEAVWDLDLPAAFMHERHVWSVPLTP